MQEKKEYHTRQRQRILALLEEKRDAHVTADQVLGHLRQNGERVGLTTVYRNLDRLVQENIVVKYIGLGGSSASYQYIGSADEHSDHYHLICLECGQLVHLQCNLIDEFAAHILQGHRFLLDSMKTVFYGYCEGCAAQREPRADNTSEEY